MSDKEDSPEKNSPKKDSPWENIKKGMEDAAKKGEKYVPPKAEEDSKVFSGDSGTEVHMGVLDLGQAKRLLELIKSGNVPKPPKGLLQALESLVSLKEGDKPSSEHLLGLLEAISSEGGEKTSGLSTKQLLRGVKKFGKAYSEDCVFSHGDIVVLKEGFRTTKVPGYNQPCFVLECHPEDMIHETTGRKDAGYIGFREKRNLKVLLLDEDNDPALVWFDRQRFKIFNEDD